MGGALSLAAVAGSASGIDCAVPFYGLAPEKYDMSLIQVPIQGHFAELDHWCTPPLVEELQKSLTCPNEIIIYPGAKHAFTDELRPDMFDADLTEKSLDRTLVFFGQHLFGNQ
jgi:carboxymethylenebutenolidase